MVNLPISPELMRQIQALAEEHGLSVEEYLKREVLNTANASEESPSETASTTASVFQNLELTFFDTASDMLAIANQDGYFVRVNRAFCETLGYTAEELCSRPYVDFVHPEDRNPTVSAKNDINYGQNIRDFENRYRRKDGEYIWITWTAILNHQDGYVYGVARESTRRKQEVQQLRYETEQINNILQRITDGFCAINAEQRLVYMNGPARSMLNVDEDAEIVGQPARDVISQFKNPIFLEHFRRAHEHNQAEDFIIFETTNNMWIEVKMYPSSSGMSIYLRNISNEYTTEAHLRESESQFRGLFENALDAILICDDHGRIVQANPAAHHLYGYEPGRMNGKHLKDIYHYMTDLQKNFNAAWQSFLQSGAQSGQIIIQRPDGVQRIAEYQSKAYISTNRHISTLRDVTEREEAIVNMRQSEERVRQLAENANEVFWLGDVESGTLLYVSPAFQHIWGVEAPPLKELSPDYLLGFVHDEDKTIMREYLFAMTRIVTSGEEYYSEYRIIRPDGDIRWIRSRFVGVRNGDGLIYRYAGISTDITPTKIMEHALLNAVDSLEERVEQRTRELTQMNMKLQQQVKARREAQRDRERLATILEVTSDFVGIFNNEMQLTFLNNAGRKMIGMDEIDSIDNLMFWDLYPGWIHAIVRDMVASANDMGIASGEATLFGIDGQELPVSQVIITRRSDQGEVEFYAVVCRDISEAKRTENSLLQRIATEKEINEFKTRYMAILSHEFRTPLQGILNSSEMVKNYSERLPEERKIFLLSRIEKNVKQMNTLIEIIMSVGQSNNVQLDFKPDSLDITQFCKDVIDEVSFANSSSHVIEYLYDECPFIQADSTLLYQAVSNLLTNAMKYSPERNRIVFRLWPEGDYVAFSVQDFGIGIPDYEIPTLFEVFKRASNVGTIQGKGLGLAVVKSVIDAHSGSIDVQSKLNNGTTFIVRLPVDFKAINEDTQEIEV